MVVACLGLGVNACVSTGPKADLAGRAGARRYKSTIRLSEELQPERPLVEMHLMAGFSRAGMDVYFLGSPSTAGPLSACIGWTNSILSGSTPKAPRRLHGQAPVGTDRFHTSNSTGANHEQSACNSAPRCPSFLVALETLAKVAGVEPNIILLSQWCQKADKKIRPARGHLRLEQAHCGIETS